ncbi:MAG: hypothetical protein U0359_35620 [Byssovorax sp.]
MDENKRTIRELRKRHDEILDGKATHGEGTRQEQARRYWLEEMSGPIIEQAREKLEGAGALPKVGLLISIAGFSPQTTMITAGVLRPEEVLVISSDESYAYIDTIADFLLKNGLRQRHFRHESCVPSDLSIYEMICRHVRAYDERRAREGKKSADRETVVDITGGKKLMSAGAAMAASELDLRIAYVNNKYDDERRIAAPGTEEVLLFDSPYLLYGGGEERRADHDFDMGAYTIARARYEKLAERLSEPGRARFLRDLSSFYEAWRNLDIEGLKVAMPKIKERLAQPGPLSRMYGAKLEAQLAFIERLIADEHPARIMTLFLLGEANMEAGRYDFSSLLFYRTIEASIASRLEARYPGFSCEAPDYAKIDPDEASLQGRFQALAREVYGKQGEISLPRAVGCLDGAILLCAEKDPLSDAALLGNAKALSQLRNLANGRNRSILAHGYQSVSRKDCEALRGPAQQTLSAYWSLHGEAEPYAKAVKALRFVRIGE